MKTNVKTTFTRKDLVKVTGATENEIKYFLRTVIGNCAFRGNWDRLTYISIIYYVYAEYGTRVFNLLDSSMIESYSKSFSVTGKYVALTFHKNQINSIQTVDSIAELGTSERVMLVDIFQASIITANTSSRATKSEWHKVVTEKRIGNEMTLSHGEQELIKRIRKNNGEYLIEVKNGTLVSLKSIANNIIH